MKKLLYILLLITGVAKAQSPVSPIGPVATQFYYDTSDSSHWTHDVRGYFKLNAGGGGGGGTWGSITGTLSNQIDLQAALDAKQNLLMFGNGIITTSGITGLGGTLIRTTTIDNTGFDFTIADNTGTGLYLIPNFKGFYADDGAGHIADLLIQGTESGKATAGFFMDALDGATEKSIDATDNAIGHGIWVQDTKDRIGLNAKSQPNYTGTGTSSLQYTTRHYVDSVATGGGGGVTSVSGTANRITSTGGATPVIDISASYAGQSSITALGTITTGVWNGTAIANANLANSSTTVNGTSINLGASGTVTAAAGTLTGTTLNSSVVTSSLTSVGTLSSGAIPWSLITNTPTTIAGYGITDGLTLTGTQSISNKTFRPANIFQTGLGTAGTDSLVVKTSGALKAISPTYYQIAGTYVTGIGVTTANGISGSSSGGTTPNLTLTLGNIVPTTISTTIKPATVYQTAAGTAGTDSVMVKHSGGIVDAISPTYYLASTTAASTYVPQTTTVNGKALSSNITLGLASSDFANQGTTTTVLHGNASGNPSFAQIGITDLSATGTPSSATFLRGDNTWGTPVGTLTASNFIFNEVPSGTINGSNVTFTLANTPTSGTVQIYKNGLRQTLTADYTISGSTITFSTAPSSTGFSDVLIADYLK